MKGFSFLLPRLVVRHRYPETRYQMSYVCVLGFQHKRSEMALKKLVNGTERFLNV